MRILLVHLSDIHLGAASEDVALRLLTVKQAIVGKSPRADACFLIVSGDIANTGATEEYELAARTLRDLRSSLLTSAMPQVEIIAIPGNHDCDFDAEVDTRKFLLNNLDAYLAEPLQFEGLNFEAVISVQANFFSFEADLCEHGLLPNHERLYYKRSFSVNGNSVLFHCFNTSWLSRRRDVQSQLFIPAEVLTGSTPPTTALSIALFHHPYNWLRADNYQHLKDFVESQSDVVLTGHEHVPGLQRVLSLGENTFDTLQAPAFADPRVNDEGFQLLLLDDAQSTQVVTRFAWMADRFSETDNAVWELKRNAARPANPFTTSATFAAELTQVGTGFNHPRCGSPRCALVLRDLFVYPDLRYYKIDRITSNSASATENIQGAELIDFVLSKKQVIVYGAEDSGKSSLCRIVYEDLLERGFVPLLVEGEKLRSRQDDASLVALLLTLSGEQYSESSAEPFIQQSREQKVLIIDGLERAKLGLEGQRTLIQLLSDRFGLIFATASDLFHIQEIARTEGSALSGFARCALKEFGSFHRHRLIEKWIYHGRDAAGEDGNLERLVLEAEKTLSTIMGKNVLPHHPVTILTLMQLIDGRETPNTANGSYGYFYEYLIKESLARINPRDVDAKLTYISGIGYSMFKSRQLGLTEEEMREAHAAYCARYDMVRDFPRMMSDLIKAEILVEQHQLYKFKYPYIFYYSTAKFFQNQGSRLRSEVMSLADYIYNGINANVLIFYVYLTKDPDLISHLVQISKRIYAEHPACDMDEHVAFLNALQTNQPPPLELELASSWENRQEHNRKQDEAAEQDSALQVSEEEDVIYDAQLQDIIKISIAFKTLQLLGQVLRNFTGSLEGPQKLEITKECYSLGMRTLQAILSIASDVDTMRQYIGSLIAERTGITDKRKLANKTDDAIVWLGGAAAFGAVKRISYAVGHHDLLNTYGRVLEESDALANQIIDAAIKLDHFDRVPERELRKLEARVKNNPVAWTVVRDLVADYLYLYSVDFPTMQKLGTMWNIKVSVPRFLSNRSKKN